MRGDGDEQEPEPEPEEEGEGEGDGSEGRFQPCTPTDWPPGRALGRRCCLRARERASERCKACCELCSPARRLQEEEQEEEEEEGCKGLLLLLLPSWPSGEASWALPRFTHPPIYPSVPLLSLSPSYPAPRASGVESKRGVRLREVLGCVLVCVRGK